MSDLKILQNIREGALRIFWRKYGIIFIFSIFYIFLAFKTESFFSIANQVNVLRQLSILGIVSVGVFSTAIGGNIDLSVGSMVGFASAILAKMAFQGFGTIPSLIVTALVLALVGFINGYLSTRAKNLSIIVTLSTGLILYSGTMYITQLKPIVNFQKSLLILGKGSIGPVPLPIIILVLIMVGAGTFFSYTIPAKRLYAVGSNNMSASIAGIQIKKYQIITFMASALLACLAGIILMGRVASAQPNAGVGLEMDAIGAILIGGASLSGGRGTIRGIVFGVLIIGLINNGMNLLGVDPMLVGAVKGSVILFAILMDQWEWKSE